MGHALGPLVGERVGFALGCFVGMLVGSVVGCGVKLGAGVGRNDGRNEGLGVKVVGLLEGCELGCDGSYVGSKIVKKEELNRTYIGNKIVEKKASLTIRWRFTRLNCGSSRWLTRWHCNNDTVARGQVKTQDFRKYMYCFCLPADGSLVGKGVGLRLGLLVGSIREDTRVMSGW